MSRKIKKKTEIQKFLENQDEGADANYFYILLKPITDDVWKDENDTFYKINDADGESIDQEYLYVIIHRIITKVYTDHWDKPYKFSLSMEDCENVLTISTDHIECVWEYEGDEQQEELQEEYDNNNKLTSLRNPDTKELAPSGFKGIAMTVGKKVGQTVIDGAMLGVGKRVSKKIQTKTLAALKKAGTPDFILENELFKAMVLIAGPELIKLVMIRFPKLKLNKEIFINAIDMARVSAIADTTDTALEQLENILKPMFKEIKTMIPKELMEENKPTVKQLPSQTKKKKSKKTETKKINQEIDTTAEEQLK